MLALTSGAWFSASKAMPAVNAPSPITAIALRSLFCRRAAMAMPNAALIEVLEWPTPKVSYSLSARRGNAAMPSFWRSDSMRVRRPVRILCGYA
ncbi:hypothetical protein D3C86_391390 [compost metagenome]